MRDDWRGKRMLKRRRKSEEGRRVEEVLEGRSRGRKW